MTLDEITRLSPVIPVLTIERAEDAVPLGRALVEGGLRVLEVTLRTPAALEAIRRMSGEIEGAVVGAGTVLRPKDLDAAAAAGARFAVSPGATEALLAHPRLPLLPGASTVSEAMRALEHGIELLKFFPAVPAGGAAFLAALAAPLPSVRFCPTGGVTPANAPDFLKLPNVVCVGGSWMVPKTAVAERNWDEVRRLSREAAALRAP